MGGWGGARNRRWRSRGTGLAADVATAAVKESAGDSGRTSATGDDRPRRQVYNTDVLATVRRTLPRPRRRVQRGGRESPWPRRGSSGWSSGSSRAPGPRRWRPGRANGWCAVRASRDLGHARSLIGQRPDVVGDGHVAPVFPAPSRVTVSRRSPGDSLRVAERLRVGRSVVRYPSMRADQVPLSARQAPLAADGRFTLSASRARL